MEREVETDLGMIEKLLGYNKGRKEMRMVVVGWESGEGRRESAYLIA